MGLLVSEELLVSGQLQGFSGSGDKHNDQGAGSLAVSDKWFV